jgi:cell wall-active antibiotic response 4TMS protein YvqF
MSDRSAAYFLSAIRGPITLITIGVLFALNNFTTYRFEQTWPVILIVFGLFSLLRRSMQPPSPPPPPYGYAPPAPPPAYPQTPYSQTTYAQPPVSTPAHPNETETPGGTA